MRAECCGFEWDRILGLLITAISKPLFCRKNLIQNLAMYAKNYFQDQITTLGILILRKSMDSWL